MRPLEGVSGLELTDPMWSELRTLRTRREGGAWRTRPLEGERGLIVICNGFTGGRAKTEPAGAAVTTGTAETIGLTIVSDDGIQIVVEEGILDVVRMHEADRGARAKAGESSVRTRTAEDERDGSVRDDGVCGIGVNDPAMLPCCDNDPTKLLC